MNDLVHALMQARQRNASARHRPSGLRKLHSPLQASSVQPFQTQVLDAGSLESPLKPWGPPVDELPGFTDGLDDQLTPDEREAKARTAQNIEMLIKELEKISDPRAQKARVCQSHFPSDAVKFEACFDEKDQPV